MRKLLIAGVFAIAYAFAPTHVYAQAVAVQPSTTTACVPVSVSSSVVTAMQTSVDASTAPSIITILSIQNQDGTHAIYCSHDPAVAVSGTTHLGWEIAANGSKDFTILGTQQWYCLAATAGVQAVVCKTH